VHPVLVVAAAGTGTQFTTPIADSNGRNQIEHSTGGARTGMTQYHGDSQRHPSL
jgi:hypothetical protein